MSSNESERDKITGGVDNRIARMVRLARNRSSSDKNELAALIGVTPSTWDHWEEGKEKIPAQKLLQIANALEVPVSYFFGFPYSQRAPSPADSITRDMMDCFGLIFELQTSEEVYELKQLLLYWMETRTLGRDSV